MTSWKFLKFAIVCEAKLKASADLNLLTGHGLTLKRRKYSPEKPIKLANEGF